jgi:hypothetical protein
VRLFAVIVTPPFVTFFRHRILPAKHAKNTKQKIRLSRTLAYFAGTKTLAQSIYLVCQSRDDLAFGLVPIAFYT